MIVRIALYFVPMCDRHLIISKYSIILGILGLPAHVKDYSQL